MVFRLVRVGHTGFVHDSRRIIDRPHARRQRWAASGNHGSPQTVPKQAEGNAAIDAAWAFGLVWRIGFDWAAMLIVRAIGRPFHEPFVNGAQAGKTLRRACCLATWWPHGCLWVLFGVFRDLTSLVQLRQPPGLRWRKYDLPGEHAQTKAASPEAEGVADISRRLDWFICPQYAIVLPSSRSAAGGDS